MKMIAMPTRRQSIHGLACLAVALAGGFNRTSRADGAGFAALTTSDPRLPDPKKFTQAPLRNRIRVLLNAPVGEVWALVGDHKRLPEYTAGIERVEVVADPGTGSDIRICHFKPRDGSAVGLSLREVVRWYEPGLGYATTSEPSEDFALKNDLSLVSVFASNNGTVITWDQHFDADDLPMMRAEFDGALADMAKQLVARFGGGLIERYVDGPM